MSKRRLAATVWLAFGLAALGAGEATAGPGKKTHLGVKTDQIVSLTTGVLPNDNSGGHEFGYDSTSGPFPFAVPEKYSFVVTDVQVLPNTPPVPGDFLVVINIGAQGSRTFDVAFSGVAFYQSLTTGFVVPGGTTPTARNTTFSTAEVSVKLQGYYVKGSGLPEREPAF